MDNRLDNVVTHVTSFIFFMLGVATYLLRWLVNSWAMRAPVGGV